MTDVDLSAIDITGIEEHPPDTSVKLNGPPGTGKTTESAARVATLIEEYGYNIDDVLWATYRNSLATETLQRLAGWGVIDDQQLDDASKGATRYIGTVHAVGSRLVGGTPTPVKYSNKKEFAKAHGLRYDSQSPWDEPPGQLLYDVFDYAAKNLLDLHNPANREMVPMLADLQNSYRGDIGRIWDDWQEYKEDVGRIDFWEQLAAPLRQNATPSHPIVVIDEYHDAYPLMAKLAEEWIEAADIAIVAGDPLQVVNHYAGADPRHYKKLDLPEVMLPKAWTRPPREHWAVATALLANAHEPPAVEIANSGSFRVGQSPTMKYDSDDGWRVPGPDRSRSPAWFVDEFGTDTMFLTRTQKQATGVARALEKAGVLYETQSSMDITGWGGRDEMAERTAVYNALQKVKSGALDGGEHGLGRYDDSGDTSGGEIVFRHREAAALLDHAKAKYLSVSRGEATKAANRIQNKETVVYGDELTEFTKPEFWNVYGYGAGTVRYLKATANRDDASQLNATDREALQAALEHNDEPVLDVDTKVYTIHASKGSEAHNVVVYDGITGRIREGMQEDDNTRKNEWRTWYVALTRSRANLFVLRDGFPWTRSFLPPNLVEMAERGVKA